MSLFSFLRKNKPEPAADDRDYQSSAESDTQAVRARKRKTVSRGADGSSNRPVDPVLPEKKRARRRLVGAVALVLAVIIGLPMMLDSEPKGLADDLSIEIPSKDKVVAVPSPSASDKAGAPLPAAAGLDQKEELIDPAGMPQKGANARPAPAAGTATEKAMPAAADKSSQQADAKLAEKSAAKPTDKTGEQAAAKAAEKTAEKSSEKAAEKAAEKTAEKAAEKAAEKTAEKNSEKTAEKAAANQAAKDKAAASKASAEPITDGKHEKFTVQVAALASMDKANELRDRLKQAGIESYVQRIATSGGERIRVRVGSYSSRQEADKVKARLAMLGLGGTVMPLPG